MMCANASVVNTTETPLLIKRARLIGLLEFKNAFRSLSHVRRSEANRRRRNRKRLLRPRRPPTRASPRSWWDARQRKRDERRARRARSRKAPRFRRSGGAFVGSCFSPSIFSPAEGEDWGGWR